MPHEPLLQSGPPFVVPGQTFPHAPQLFVSVLTLLQLEPQTVYPAGQHSAPGAQMHTLLPPQT